MKDNKQNILNRDLEVIPLIAYFVFYFLYLFFDIVWKQKDYALLVKPILVPIIVFLYLSNKDSKKNVLSILLLILFFISDNSTLLEMRSFHIYTTLIYLICNVILLFYAVTDIKYFAKRANNFVVALVLIGLTIISFSYLVLNFDLKEKSAEKFVAYEYLILFFVLFVFGVFNFIIQKTKKTKYLFLTILCLFLTDLCFSIHNYYNGPVIFKFLVFIVEIPVYYFLLKYLLLRDKYVIEQ